MIGLRRDREELKIMFWTLKNAGNIMNQNNENHDGLLEKDPNPNDEYIL